MLINYDGFVSLFPSTGMISSIKTRIVIRRKTWDQGSHFKAHICFTNHFDRHTKNAFWKDLYSAFERLSVLENIVYNLVVSSQTQGGQTHEIVLIFCFTNLAKV